MAYSTAYGMAYSRAYAMAYSRAYIMAYSWAYIMAYSRAYIMAYSRAYIMAYSIAGHISWPIPWPALGATAVGVAVGAAGASLASAFADGLRRRPVPLVRPSTWCSAGPAASASPCGTHGHVREGRQTKEPRAITMRATSTKAITTSRNKHLRQYLYRP